MLDKLRDAGVFSDPTSFKEDYLMAQSKEAESLAISF